MKIEKISINALKPYENNAKVHTEKQIGQIKKSIQEFGNNDPIAIDENNIIIEGHGRYQALKELNYKEIDVIKLVHLTNDQKKAYSLVHNKLTMNTGFDLDKINIELENIKNIDMSEFDFNINLDFSFGNDSEDTDENTKNAELDTENFDDGSFKHECPRCKFKWNDE